MDMTIEKIIEQINRKHSIDIRNILQKYPNIPIDDLFLYAFIIADEVLNEYRKSPKAQLNTKCPSTNIKGICRDLFNIEIFEKTLNSKYDCYDNELGAYFDIYSYSCDDNYTKTIFLNSLYGGLARHTFLAYVLSGYILNCIINKNFDISSKKSKIYFFTSRATKDRYSFLYNIIASYLLVPIDVYCDLFINVYEEATFINIYYRPSIFEFYVKVGSECEIKDASVPVIVEHLNNLINILYNYDGKLALNEVCTKIRSEKYNKIIR